MTSEQTSEAWRIAGGQLGVQVAAPAEVVINGASVGCVAFLPDFGSTHGTAAFSLSVTRSLPKTTDADPFCSLLDDVSYGEFVRDRFIATLNDWGWFGEGQPPDWYEGIPGPTSSGSACGGSETVDDRLEAWLARTIHGLRAKRGTYRVQASSGGLRRLRSLTGTMTTATSAGSISGITYSATMPILS